MSAGCDGFVYFWRFEEDNLGNKLSLIHRFQAHKTWIRDLAFSPQINSLWQVFVTASEDKTCKIWKFRKDNNEFYHEFNEIKFESPVWRVSWNFTGNLLSVGFTSVDRKNMVAIYS